MKQLLTVVLLALAVAACGATATPGGSFDSPITSPVAPITSQPLAGTPTPVAGLQPGTGSATGQLIDGASGQPLADRLIYLGEWRTMEAREGEPTSFVYLLPSSAPSTSTDQEGRFAFSSVEPNEYAILVWSPTKSAVVSEAGTQQAVVVTIEPDKVTELGRIEVEDVD